jgi:SAM-dependent methyltransferase
MRPHIRAFLERCVQRLDCPEPVVEIGSQLPDGQEAIADLRPLFSGRTYIGCDMQAGPGVDRVEDIHHLTFPDGAIGTCVMSDTLEHVWDPIRALAEVHRAVKDDGVVIFTSVMHFPIHSYPNDYWRFTPEAFRDLAGAFATAAIFYCGDKNFPHTVAGVAVKSNRSEQMQALAADVAGLETPAPLHTEGQAAAQVRHLAQRLLEEKHLPPDPRRGDDSCGLGPALRAPGWTLVGGQWLEGWVAGHDASEVELRCGDVVVHRAALTAMTEFHAAHLGVAKGREALHFRGQARLEGVGDQYGSIRLLARDDRGNTVATCASAPGIVLGTLTPQTGFVLHSLDVNREPPHREGQRMNTGRQLVEALRAEGQEIVVDLGCGFRKEGNIGIDATAEGTQADLICRLGFEPIPLDDECADKVFCRDFLEHVPKAVFVESHNRLRYPVIDLMNEIWRILKPEGVFESLTPCYPNPEVHQDPTHTSVWTTESMQYFCGKYPIANVYGVRARFEVLESDRKGFYLHAKLRKPAGGGPDPR